MAIRFHEDEVRQMGLVAAGVNGIKLGARDVVIGMELIPRRGDILLVASDGKAKRVASDQFPRQGRYGQGVIAWKLPRTAQVVGIAAGKATTRITVLIDKLSPKAIRLDEAPLQTRAASGKTIIELKPGYQVQGLSISWVVPRAVAGEKTSPEKEPEVPEEADEPVAPEIEQLTFGMIEPVPTAISKTPKTATRKPRTAATQKSVPDQPKARKTRVAKAALVTKTVSSRKPTSPTRTSRSKSLKAGTPRKMKASEKAVQAPLLENKAAKAEPGPVRKAGRSSTSKTASPAKPTAPLKTTRGKPGVKPPSTAGKKPASKAGTKVTTGSAKSTGKKPAAKAGTQSTRKISKTNPRQTKPTTSQSTKSTPIKPGARKKSPKKLTIKNATAPLVVILPPSWKPKRAKITPSRRIVKPNKPTSD
jgi:DNA gyrase subunit A